MAAQAILVLCAQALLIQSAVSQCINPAVIDATGFTGPYGHSWAYDGLTLSGLNWGHDGLVGDAWPGLGFPCSAIEITPTAGGLLPVTSASAIPPVGITVVSENAYEGLVTVAGEVPFVGTTGMEGTVPTGGVGAINYGCGNGVTAMVSEVGPAAFGPAAFGPAAFGPVIASAAFAPAIGAASLGSGPCSRGYLF